MIPYFIMFIIPAFITLFIKNNNIKIFLYLVSILFIFFIGFRFDIGGDWDNYLYKFNNIQYKTYLEILLQSDPGYYLLNKFMNEMNLGIFAVNFVCATFFIIGLLQLAKNEYNPWMVLTVAVPYTITVVAMGYTRQAVALGFVMWAIVYLRQNRMLGFFLLIILAATFHKSAVLIIGLGIFANNGSKFLKVIAVGAIGIGVYNIFLASYTDRLVSTYIEGNIQSSGALIRTFMNFIPAILLVIYRKKWKEIFDDFTFWFIISILSIISFAIVGVASTAIDRMALYLIPIQFIVFARLSLLMSDRFNPSYINLSIISYYGLVLFIWLNFAKYAHAWLPYQNILFLDLY